MKYLPVIQRIGLAVMFLMGAVFGQPFDKIAFGKDVDSMLVNHYLKKYYPKVVDPKGGIYCGYDRQFNPVPPAEKPLNIESRHLWASSMGILLDPSYAGFRQAADAAYFYIRDNLWDKSNNGSAIRGGTPVGQYLPCDKPVYANGFALCGLSAYYMATKDTQALNIAISTWKWIDDKAYDRNYGMYYGWLNNDGTLANNNRGKNQDVLHHWIEGMAWLYAAWPGGRPDSSDRALLKSRVMESSDIFCSSKWIRGDGSIVLDNNREMTAGSGVYEGLDVEDVYLFYFYYQAIDTVPPQPALDNLEKLVNWSKARTRAGVHFSTQWWPDAELFTAFAGMAVLYGMGDSYLSDCKTHWGYIKQHYFDPVYGGWYTDPDASGSPKGHAWCATYHGGKCMLFVRNWLLGSKKGWVVVPVSGTAATPPGQTSSKIGRAQQPRYVVISKTDRTISRNCASLYDLKGRSATLSQIQAGLRDANSAGMFIAKH